jgi:hypothetical protein
VLKTFYTPANLATAYAVAVNTSTENKAHAPTHTSAHTCDCFFRRGMLSVAASRTGLPHARVARASFHIPNLGCSR